MKEIKWIRPKHRLPKFGQVVIVKYKPDRNSSLITMACCFQAVWAKSGKPVGKPYWSEVRGLVKINVILWMPTDYLFNLKIEPNP